MNDQQMIEAAERRYREEQPEGPAPNRNHVMHPINGDPTTPILVALGHVNEVGVHHSLVVYAIDQFDRLID
jgi:hypothetical protein